MLNKKLDIVRKGSEGYLNLTILMLMTWLGTQTLPELSFHKVFGTIISTIRSVITGGNELSLRISSYATGIGRLYEDIRRLHILGSYFLMVLLSLFSCKFKEKRKNSIIQSLIPISLVLEVIIFQSAALIWWNTRPYYFITVMFPVAHAFSMRNLIQKIRYRSIYFSLVLMFMALLIFLTPIVKWGPSPRFYPTEKDVLLAKHLSSYAVANDYVLAVGSHQLLLFYPKLFGNNLMVPEDFREADFVRLKRLVSSMPLEGRYHLFSFFYMGVTSALLFNTESEIRDSLKSTFAELNDKFNLVYLSKDFWRCYEL
jgi:hypothetical protein